MLTQNTRFGAQRSDEARKAGKMLLGLAQSLYWFASIVALTMIVTAAALAFVVDKTDGLELYAVAGLMVVAAVSIWICGRAIYRLAR
jgi:hypothetical protein